MRGHVRKRGLDSWTVVVSHGVDSQTGRRRRVWRTVRGTKVEAERVLTQLLAQSDIGIDLPPGRLTVAQYLARWLELHARQNTAPRTFLRYEQLVRLHLVPVLGSVPLAKLRPLEIQGAYSRALERGLSARTVLQAHRVLREALHHAIRWQLLGRNPADAVEAPRPERFQAPLLGLDEVGRLLEAADETPYGDLAYVAVMTGLRRGELLGLRWSDIDLETSVLHVRQTCQWLPRQGFIFRQPKSYRSTRPVALSPAAVDRIRQHRVRQLEERLAAGPAYQGHDLVFADAIGRPINPSNLRDAWKRLTRAAAVPSVRFHDLRHAHASLLMREGVHPKIVSERLGHCTVGITLDIYSHVAPSLQAQAAAKLDRLIGR